MLPFVGFHLASYPPPGYHRIAGLLPNLKEVAISPAEIGADSEDPADGGKVCLNHVAPLVGQLPLGEERAIVELKARKAARRC